ncbi:MAG: hypothetical protein GY941_12005 [Planctomycetes bacterium]|nr:hypothetical protein [Planctomycetota bacterium]
MKVTKATYLEYGACPHCGCLLDVDYTYEDGLHDCGGEFSCPSCEKTVCLDVSLKFDFDTVRDVEDLGL